jgi:hypothetical protein
MCRINIYVLEKKKAEQAAGASRYEENEKALESGVSS